MSSSNDLAMLIGESFTPDMPFGENMEGDLINGYVVGESIDFVPAVELGNGVLGPPQQQDLVIWRDNRPLAVDELGMEGPWVIPWVKVSQPVEGKTFSLNYEFGGQFDKTMPGLNPEEEPGGLLSPFPAVTFLTAPATVEVLPTTSETIYSTAGQGI
jgi:hypothetical protein